jgi:hypothetical protein
LKGLDLMVKGTDYLLFGAGKDAIVKFAKAKAQKLRDSVLGPAKDTPKILSPDEIVKLNPPINLGPMNKPTTGEMLDKLSDILTGGKTPPDSVADVKGQKADLQKKIDEVNKFWADRIQDAADLRDSLIRNGYKTPADATAEYNNYVKSYKAQRDEVIKGLQDKMAELDRTPSRDVLDLVRRGGYRDRSVSDYVRRLAANQAAKEFDTKAQKLVDFMISRVSKKEWTSRQGLTWLQNVLGKLEKRVETKYKKILNQVLDD